MRFTDIPGLEELKEQLMRNIDSGMVAHAQMFAGPSGSAKLALALAYATTLNCTNKQGMDACGECPSCHKISKYIHPDLHFAFPVSTAPSKQGKPAISDTFISDWRNFLDKNLYAGAYSWSQEYGGEDKQLNISREESRQIVKKLTLKSFEGAFKIMIIWLPEYMHPAAANALLKLLEEPPEQTVFLMISDDHEKIIGTILSRVQLLRIRPFKQPEIAQYLQKQMEVDESKANQIAGICSGDLNQAINLIHEVEDDSPNAFQDWMRSCFMYNYQQLVDAADNFSRVSKINQKGLFQYGLSIIRQSMLLNNGAGEIVHSSSLEKDFIGKFSPYLTLNRLQMVYGFLNDAFYHLERNGNPKIIFLDTSLKIAAAFKS